MFILEQILKENGLEAYAPVLRENRIDLDVISYLTTEDLKEMAIPLGDRKRLLNLAKKIKKKTGSLGLSKQPSEPLSQNTHEDNTDVTKEIRQITVLFADLVGSTPMAERLDVEDYHSALLSFHACCTKVVKRNGGTPTKFIGDASLACFGYPAAGENDADRAILAGLQIIDEMGHIQTSDATQLQARVGIATGLAMTGKLFGDGQEFFGPATGSTLNLASRLQTLAEPGMIMVDQKTQSLARKVFHFSSLGKQRLKGFEEPKEVWRVKGSKDFLEPALRPVDQTNKIVGRTVEMRHLLQHWKSVGHTGSVVFVAGEVGIGKSRLVSEFANSAGISQQQFVSMECLPNKTLRPLYPMTKGIERLAAVDQVLGVEARFDQLRKWAESKLKLSFEDSNAIAQLTAPGKGGLAYEVASPKEHKSRIFEALIQFFKHLGRKTPRLVIFEDIHWIDPTTQEFLDHLVSRIATLKAMVVCTYRPGYYPNCVGEPRVSVINLPRLEAGNATEVMEGVLGKFKLPTEMVQEIISRADGVPFFIEELTKSAVEAASEGNASFNTADKRIRHLPTTLRGSLLARLDRVPNASQIAPIGAAIGRTFRHDLLFNTMSISDEKATQILSDLVSAGLVAKLGKLPNIEYRFSHALVQDAAYDTMPKSRRIRVHKRIAKALEYGDGHHSHYSPDALAWHYSLAQEHKKASDYWKDAAIAAQKSSANQEAVGFIQSALEANNRSQPNNMQIDREIELREMLRNPFARVNLGSPQTVRNLERLKELREIKGHTNELVSVLHGLAAYYLIIGEVSLAQKVADQLLSQFGDENLIARILGFRVRAFALFLGGEFDASIDFFSRTIDLSDEIPSEDLSKFYHADTRLVARCMMCWVLALRDQTTDLTQRIADAKKDADQSDVWNRIYAYSVLCAAYQVVGDVEECHALSLAGKSLSEEHGYEYWVAWCSILHGWAVARQGRGTDGIIEIEKGLDRYYETGSRQLIPYGQFLLADAHLASNLHGRSKELFRQLKEQRTPAEVRYIDKMLTDVIASIVGPDPSK